MNNQIMDKTLVTTQFRVPYKQLEGCCSKPYENKCISNIVKFKPAYSFLAVVVLKLPSLC